MDPYTVIGASPDASDDDIKKKYRELVKKFHPDRYNGTGMEDVATEKMQRVNEAYDTIMNERKGRSNNSSYRTYEGNSQGGRSYQGSGNYQKARSLIDQGMIIEAENILNSMDVKDAEWYFLSGLVAWRKGWTAQAKQNIQMAVNMDSSNAEYRQAYNQLNMVFNRNRYSGQGQRGVGNNCSVCDICTTLWCADCCCECAGGDLIPCC